MAVPESVGIADLSGKFVLNKNLSDMKWEVLKLAGVSWLVRKALQLGQLHLHIKHYADDNNIERLDITQVLYGGIPLSSTLEQWILDWDNKHHEDYVWGAVIGKSRRVEGPKMAQEYPDISWTPDTIESGFIHGHIETNPSKNWNTWSVEQTWGMAMIEGERHYIRINKFTGPSNEVITAKLVYDYVGPLK